MFSRHHRKAKGIVGLVDATLISLAFAAAYNTRAAFAAYQNRVSPELGKVFHAVFYIEFPIASLLLIVSILCWLAIGYWFNIYEKLDSARPSVVLRDTFQQCLLGGICLVIAEYLLRLDLSRFFVTLFAVYAWIFLCLFRVNAARAIGAVRKRFATAQFVMVVGSNERAREFGQELEQTSALGIRLVGFLDEEAGEVQLARVYRQYPLSELPQLLQQQVIDEIIFCVDSDKLRKMEEIFLLCDEQGIRTRVAVDFFPHVHSQIYLDRFGRTPLLTFSAGPHDEIRLMLKRVTDILLAGAALIFLLPWMLLIALIIRMTSPGPAIFFQQRCGLNGRRFTFYKFRSMCDNAEELKPALMHLNRKSTAFKIPNDPRMTGVGRVLRKFSIDEWPQLWNVLKGDMSLVGPRPAVPEEVEMYQKWQRRRLRMRPGLTCLWALAGRDTLDFDSWMKMDMQYIDTWSLQLDWNIILRTIPRVLTGRGAH